MSDPPTPLDMAACTMAEAPDDPGPRLRFYERVIDAELYLLLDTEAEGQALRPRMFELVEGPVVLAFDRDVRLATFIDAPAPYAIGSGRRLAAMLAGRGVGVVLNAETPASQTMLSAATVDWLASGAAPAAASARAREVGPPVGVPPALIAAVGEKLAAMADIVAAAWLVRMRLLDGGARLTLAVVGPPAAAEPAVAGAIAEAVRFCGLDAGELDVTFVADGTRTLAACARVGLRFEPPVRDAAERRPRPGGGSGAPPKLRWREVP